MARKYSQEYGDAIKEVELPDGNIVEFPDSMSDEEINRQMISRFGNQFPAQQQQYQNQEPTSQVSSSPENKTKNMSFMQGLSNNLNSSNVNNAYTALKALTNKGMPLAPVAENLGNLTMFLGPEVKMGSLAGTKGFGDIFKQILSNIGKVGSSAYLGTKVMPGSTQEEAQKNAAIGGAISGVATPLGLATASMNPFVRLGAGAGIGALAGTGVGAMTGSTPLTSSLGGIAGGLLGLRGRGASEMAARNIENAMTPEQQATALTRQAAGKEIGVPLTLAEASGSPILGTMQGQATSNIAGSKILYPFGTSRLKSEEKAYNNLLESVSPQNAQTNIINPLYKKAETDVINNSDLTKLLSEPTIKEAFDVVQNDPYYSRALKDTPVNSIKYLDQVKKILSDRVESTLSKGEKHRANLQKEDVDKVLQVMDKASPTYKSARQAASQNFNRVQIEDAMAKSSITGSNFYDKVLSNPKEYKILYEKLGDPDNPKVQTAAQKNLQAMKTAFPDLIDNITAKSSSTLAEKNPDLHFNIAGLAKSLLNKVYMDRYNKAIAELLTNPNWSEELNKISKLSGEDRGIKLSRLISRIAVTGSAGINQNSQGSNNHGVGF